MTAWTVHIEVMVTEKLSAVEWELHKQSCISLGGRVWRGRKEQR